MDDIAKDYRTEIFDTYRTHFYRHRSNLSREGVEKSARIHLRWLGSHLPEDRDERILEIGVGNGGFLFCCREQGYTRVQGIDISGEQVDFCRQLGFADVEQADGLSFLRSCSEHFGLIVMTDVLEHVPKPQVVELLQEVFERLRPGGKVILRVPNMSNPLNLRTRYVDFTHEVGFSKESLQQVLRVSGFAVERIVGTFVPDPRWPFRVVFDVLLWKLFVHFYRRTLHLSAEIVRGKNLLAVGVRPA